MGSFPKFKKEIKDFLSSEDGKITKQSAFAIGSVLVGGALATLKDVAAGDAVYHANSFSNNAFYAGGDATVGVSVDHSNHTTHSTHSTHSNCYGGSRDYSDFYAVSQYSSSTGTDYNPTYGDASGYYVFYVYLDVYYEDVVYMAYTMYESPEAYTLFQQDISCLTYDKYAVLSSPAYSHSSHATHSTHGSHSSGW